MALTLNIPKEYGYVLLTATLSTAVATWHALKVGTLRKAAKVPYPNAYASAAEAKEDKEKYVFNCAQRAHANYNEHHPSFLVGLLISGLRYPVISSVVGTAWCASRVAYMIGYCRRDKSDGKGRINASYAGLLLEFGLLAASGVSGVLTLVG